MNLIPRVLVACEFSGRVRDAFLGLGLDAISCDFLPTETPGPHIQGDVREVLGEDWDLIIAHPPCTYMTNAGRRWLYSPCPRRDETVADRWMGLIEGAAFFRSFLEAPAPRVAVENPVMNGHAQMVIGRPMDFSIHPWQFGDPFLKWTCFWTRGLPPAEARSDRKARGDQERAVPPPGHEGPREEAVGNLPRDRSRHGRAVGQTPSGGEMMLRLTRRLYVDPSKVVAVERPNYEATRYWRIHLQSGYPIECSGYAANRLLAELQRQFIPVRTGKGGKLGGPIGGAGGMR